MTADYDLLIIGGGMVGASLALALADQPLRIAMVEPTPPTAARQPSYDDRVLALSWGTRRIFGAMGVWESLRNAATAIRTIHVSERGRFGSAHLDAAEQGVSALGYVVEARALGEVLNARLEAQTNLDLLRPARAVALTPDGEAASVTIEEAGGRRELTARLVVAVDGAQSPVRDQFLHLPTRVEEYGQTAVIANVTPERPHHNVAYERFTDSGPLAVLPLSLGRCAVVWTHEAEAAEATLALDDEGFLAALQERFGHRLGRFIKAGERHAYPLRLIRAEAQTAPRVALMGNAAHTLHPIAGQGFNLGLRDVALLAELVNDAIRDGADPGAGELLERYAAGRESDQRRVTTFSDGLVRLFTNPWPPLAAARGLALTAFDLCPPAKRLFAMQNMGVMGRQPRLARGLPLVGRRS